MTISNIVFTYYLRAIFSCENSFLKFNIGFKMLVIRRNFPRCRCFCCILTNTSVRKNICQVLRFAFLKIFIFTRKLLLKLTRQIETQNFRGFSVQNLFYFSEILANCFMSLYIIVLSLRKSELLFLS
jgi:hypothetical protein